VNQATLTLTQRLHSATELSSLPRSSLRALAEIGVLRNYQKGDLILAEGDSASGFYVLLSGRTKMSRATPTGRDVILSIFEPGEIFGSVAALGGQACQASITANEPSQCLEIQREQLFALLDERPGLTRELLPLLTRQLVECRNCIVELTSYRVEMRFAQIFLNLADKIGVRSNGTTLVPIKLSRRELADMTGTALETCIRTMSRWDKEGLLRKSPEGFLIHDRESLRSIAIGAER
jgi:CRP/FNR family transcriptional regulator